MAQNKMLVPELVNLTVSLPTADSIGRKSSAHKATQGKSHRNKKCLAISISPQCGDRGGVMKTGAEVGIQGENVQTGHFIQVKVRETI